MLPLHDGKARLHTGRHWRYWSCCHDCTVLCHCCCHCMMAMHVFTWQALEILELRDQLQDAQEAISEAHSNSAGLKEHNRQLEAQISRLEQQLSDALRWIPPGPHPRLLLLLISALVMPHAWLCCNCQSRPVQKQHTSCTQKRSQYPCCVCCWSNWPCRVSMDYAVPCLQVCSVSAQ